MREPVPLWLFCAWLGAVVSGCSAEPAAPAATPAVVATTVSAPALVVEALPPAPPLLTVANGEPLTNVRKLALGYGVSCALIDDGSVSCWGRNDHRQRAVTQLDPVSKAVTVPGLKDVEEIGVAFFSGCARGPGGTVRCWGEGYSSAEQPFVVVPGLSGATQISVSHYRLLALRGDGAVWCWRPGGCNPALSTIAQQNQLLGDVRQVDDHWDHACALLADGTVKCWGAIGYDASGPGQASVRTSADPVPVKGLGGVVEVALGSSHTCARVRDGSVLCWGLGWSGALGQPSLASANTPVAVPGLRDVVQLASGGSHSCALLRNGTVACWGDDGTGPRADGRRTGPVAVPGLSHVKQIACGGEHSCALIDDGTVRCWGNNTHGELGNGEMGSASAAPVHVVKY